jgi:hypothetical protein
MKKEAIIEFILLITILFAAICYVYESQLKSKQTNNLLTGALTVESLRKFDGLEDLNDDEAEKTLRAIKNLSSILYEFINKKGH